MHHIIHTMTHTDTHTHWHTTLAHTGTLHSPLQVRFSGEKLAYVRKLVDKNRDDLLSFTTFFFVMPGPHTAFKVRARRMVASLCVYL